MIKRFIKKLLGRTDPAPVATPTEAAPTAPLAAMHPSVIHHPAEAATSVPRPATGQRVEVPREVHGIDPKLIDPRAIQVVTTLQQAGFEAYIVGGAVRDLLLGHRPKDFDVATSATPEQVKGLFRRAFIIGRRFRIVHVIHGRGREHEVIEVSTFRAYFDATTADQVSGNEKTSRAELSGRLADSELVVDASGRVLRDNVWGPQDEDAARRDFTVNALYYDPQRQIVVDYHHGIEDAKQRVLRMIGDPTIRYREDPVRIIRVVRFAAKLGFEIDPATRRPIKKMADLLANVPASRMFDEMIKLLQTGHALASLEELRKQGLHQGVFPLLDAVLADAHRHDGMERFIQLALANTDQRVADGKPVAPSFMLACMLWHEVQARWTRLRADQPMTPALQQAIDEVFDARIGDISGRGKLAADMREIWSMQPRFERRTPSAAQSLVGQARYRAGYDFLWLRGQAGEIDPALAQWWDDYAEGDASARQVLLDAARKAPAPRRSPKVHRVTGSVAEGSARAEAGEPADFDAPSGTVATDSADAPKRRRRRRRKPVGAADQGGGDGDE